MSEYFFLRKTLFPESEGANGGTVGSLLSNWAEDRKIGRRDVTLKKGASKCLDEWIQQFGLVNSKFMMVREGAQVLLLAIIKNERNKINLNCHHLNYFCYKSFVP